MQLTPEPRVHTSHGGAHHEAQVVHLQALSEQAMLRADHVAVTVVRELGPESVAWLARAAVTDAVGNHYEEAACIQRLAGFEQLASEFWSKEVGPTSRCAVED